MKDLFNDEKISALSWNQPFASLMLHGKIETRGKRTKVRGKVLICSCLKPYPTSKVFEISGPDQMHRMKQALDGDNTTGLHGYAVAIGNLIDCRRMTITDEDGCFVKYNPELWCWIFADVKDIEPFKWKGKQGWKILKDSDKAKIKPLPPPPASDEGEGKTIGGI